MRMAGLIHQSIYVDFGIEIHPSDFRDKQFVSPDVDRFDSLRAAIAIMDKEMEATQVLRDIDLGFVILPRVSYFIGYSKSDQRLKIEYMQKPLESST